MSVNACTAADHGHHNFERQGRATVCRWCKKTRAELIEAAKKLAAESLKQAAEMVKLKPAQADEVAALEAYRATRERMQSWHAAIENLAAWHFHKLAPAVSADAREHVRAAVDALQKAIAGVRDPEIRECLFLSQYMLEGQLAIMEKRVADRAKNKTSEAAREAHREHQPPAIVPAAGHQVAA